MNQRTCLEAQLQQSTCSTQTQTQTQTQSIQEELNLDLFKTSVQQAKSAILATKYAYMGNTSLWPSLLDKAIQKIEQCPQTARAELFRTLSSFHEAQGFPMRKVMPSIFQEVPA